MSHGERKENRLIMQIKVNNETDEIDSQLCIIFDNP